MKKDELKEELEADLSKSGDYPDWWEPVNPGDELMGQVEAVRHDPFDDGGIVLEVSTETDEMFSTRPHTALCDIIEEKDVEEGDMVLIQFDGTIRTDKGRQMNDYALGVVKE